MMEATLCNDSRVQVSLKRHYIQQTADDAANFGCESLIHFQYKLMKTLS